MASVAVEKTPTKKYARSVDSSKLNCCRLCGEEKTRYQKVLSNVGTKKNLVSKIEQCCGILIKCDDELPSTICTACEAFVEKVIQFKTKCQRVNDEMNLTTTTKRCLKILEAMSSKKCLTTDDMKPKFAFIYSILLSSRWHELSYLKRITTVLLIEGGCSKKLQQRLTKLGVCLSYSTRDVLLNALGQHFMDGAVEILKKNATLRGTGDNWDMKIKMDHMRKAVQNKDLHLFASNLIKNRVDFKHLPNDRPIGKISELNMSKLVPNINEWKSYVSSCKVLISRILIEFFPEFKIFSSVYPDHIPHQYYDAMKEKSTTATLPIIDADEAKYQDCVKILRTYEKWIWELYDKAGLAPPDVPDIDINDVPDRNQADPGQPMAQIVFTNDDPMKNNKNQSVNEKGTLKFFREKLNRKNVTPKKVVDNYQGSEEFFLSVGKGYIVVAALKLFGMSSLDDKPADLPDEKAPENVKKEYLDNYLERFVRSYVTQSDYNNDTADDLKQNYALMTIFLTMLLLQLKDTAAEADGDRNLINQKILLVVFKALNNRSKYAIEMFVSIAQIECTLTPRLSEEFKWGFFLNWRGGKGNNIEDDLAQEICNRLSKKIVKRMGANKSMKTIAKVCKATNGIKDIVESFDQAVSVEHGSSHHTTRDSFDDEKEIIADILNFGPFQYDGPRAFECFPDIKRIPQRYLNYVDFAKWIEDKKREWSVPDMLNFE
ncbi:uncharacterized protein [Clytia hemisphaerica]|uniref:uncharacterized protein n=1 Tax=Clytia hemisphaerica TaxID=252671 RepID=UPI0034D57C21